VAGEFAVPDPKLAGISVLDLLKGVDAWMREPGRLSRRQVADTYAVLILQLMGAASP
jgi:Tetracyclin repressor-like, C-terminal domain